MTASAFLSSVKMHTNRAQILLRFFCFEDCCLLSGSQKSCGRRCDLQIFVLKLNLPYREPDKICDAGIGTSRIAGRGKYREQKGHLFLSGRAETAYQCARITGRPQDERPEAGHS